MYSYHSSIDVCAVNLKRSCHSVRQSLGFQATVRLSCVSTLITAICVALICVSKPMWITIAKWNATCKCSVLTPWWIYQMRSMRQVG